MAQEYAIRLANESLYMDVRTRSDTTPVNSDQLLTQYVSPSFSFTLVLVPHFVCSPVVPPSDYAPLVGTPVPFRMFSRVSVVLRNSGLLLVVVYLGPTPDSFGVFSGLCRLHYVITLDEVSPLRDKISPLCPGSRP